MDTRKIFEETGRLGNEINRLGKQLDKLNKQCFEMMEACPHEIVFKYIDDHPRMLSIDGRYFCPACGKTVKCMKSKDIQNSSFKNSKVVPLTNLSLIGTSELYHTIRNEVYQNIEFYYSQDKPIEELSIRMEDVVKDQEARKEDIVQVLRRVRNNK